MTILVDANILLRNLEETHPHCAIARAALENLGQLRHDVVLVPQVLYEFWVVATRAVAQNGLGLPADRASAEVDEILNLYPIYEDEIGVLDFWRIIVGRYKIVGKAAHDARLVAAMLRHDVTHLLTFNEQDFSRYAEITVVTPTAAVGAPPKP